MSNEDLIMHLCSLMQLDVDAISAYQQAIKNIDVEHIRARLIEYCHDHERHVKDLRKVIVNLGGEPPIAQPGLQGFVLESITELRSMTGTEGALRAMQSNEDLTNSAYQEMLMRDLPTEIRNLINRNYNDEKRHLSYIIQTLAERSWEQPLRRSAKA